jgi:hypothetical protein
LSGTCLTSAGRPPLQAMLATEGPGHPEGYPGPVEARYALSKLRRIPRRRSSRHRERPHCPAPMGPGAPEVGCSSHRELCFLCTDLAGS